MFGYLTLFTALIISLSAAVYSILGLTAIFAAAFWPIVVLGGSLEFGKIVTTLWLHKYWDRAELQYKVYLSSAVCILMVLTSMGVFGFLSKAHLDQAVPSGDIQAQVQIFDDKIQTQKDNIKTARAALTQMDTAVDQVMGRSNDEKGADKAVAIRRSQARERTAIQNDISKAQTEITRLQEQRAPIASQARQVEAEVGPIKYIAALIYGDNPDANILEKAVRWVIILIVIVFDPLALTLLLAATKTFEWERGINILAPKGKDDKEDKENVKSWFARAWERARFWDRKRVEKEENKVDFEGVRINGGEWIKTGPEIPIPTHIKQTDDTDNLESVFDRQKDIPEYEPDDGPLSTEQVEQIRKTVKDELPTGEVIAKESLFSDIVDDNKITAKDPSPPGWMFAAGNPHPSSLSISKLDNDPVREEPPEQIKEVVEEKDLDEDDEDEILLADKEARRAWKEAHPNDTIKKHKLLYQAGHIDNLPWNHPDYHPDYREKATPPGNDGNLWVPQNGSWINAGPMDQFDFGNLGLQADNGPSSATGEMRGFGTVFPTTAFKGDMFLRVDQLPSLLYKYNGNIWIEVDKGLSDQYAYDDAYIDHLIEKIDSGEYDPDLLSNAERDNIERRLSKP